MVKSGYRRLGLDYHSSSMYAAYLTCIAFSFWMGVELHALDFQ